MEHDVEITAEHVLHLVRSGMILTIPLEAAGIQTPRQRRSWRHSARASRRRCDAGVWKRLSNAVLEPANPFDAKARRQRKAGSHSFSGRSFSRPWGWRSTSISAAIAR